MPHSFATCATALLLVGVAAIGPARADEPKAYSCSFSAGHAFSFEGGAFKPEKVGNITFEIGNVSADIQSADLVTPAGTRPLRVVRAINAIHFLEVVGEGFLNMTTVYDNDGAKGDYPAVHSRHFGVLGQPVVGQYQGFCTGK